MIHWHCDKRSINRKCEAAFGLMTPTLAGCKTGWWWQRQNKQELMFFNKGVPRQCLFMTFKEVVNLTQIDIEIENAGVTTLAHNPAAEAARGKARKIQRRKTNC